VPLSSAKRAWIAVVVLLCLVAAGAVAYFHRQHRELPGISDVLSPGILSEFHPAANSILSQLPPGAPAIAYIDVAALRKLQGSPLSSMLELAGANPTEDRDYKDFVRNTGFDYTRDLDKTAIAFWPASMLPTSTNLGDNRAVAIADGRFNQTKIRAYALRTGKTVTRGTQGIYEVPGNPPVSFEFLSDTRIALASGRGAENLLVSSSPARTDSAMQARINRVAGAPIFAVARTDNLPANFYDSLRNSPQLASLAHSVSGLGLAGQPTGDRIQMTLDAECDSMTNAIEIATLLDGMRMFGPVALADPKTQRLMTKEQAAFLAALATQVKVTQQDRRVRLSLEITPAMLGETNSQANSNP